MDTYVFQKKTDPERIYSPRVRKLAADLLRDQRSYPYKALTRGEQRQFQRAYTQDYARTLHAMEQPTMSWKPAFEVEGKWCYNSVRFATKAEALAEAGDRFMRWTAPTSFDAHESDDPVNYKFDLETRQTTPVKEVS